jgi:hypothetical protein
MTFKMRDRIATRKVKEELWITDKPANEIWNQTGRFLLTEFQLNALLLQIVASTPSHFYLKEAALARGQEFEGF